MKKAILDRYEQTGDGEIVIDTSVGGVQDLYEDYDRFAPYLKKDLDEDFANHLIESVREILPRKFVIRVSFMKPQDEALLQRVRRSIPNYFMYLCELELRSIRTMFRKSCILFALGFVLAFVAVLVNRAVADSQSMVAEVMREGVTIAAWVSLWEAVAYLLLEWHPHRQNRGICQRIAQAPVDFRVLQGPVEAEKTSGRPKLEPER